MSGLNMLLRFGAAPTRRRPLVGSGLTCACVLLASGPAAAAVVPAQIVVRTGDAPTGGPLVDDLHHPVVNDAGTVGFVGEFVDGGHFVFVNDAVVWSSGDAMEALDNVETSMDSNGAGNFVYAVDIDGLDGLYTNMGVLAFAGDQAAGFPDGAQYVAHRRPSMTADGTIYWIAEIDSEGGPGADVQGFYRSLDGTPDSVELLLAGGDMIGRLVIDDASSGLDGGIDGDYALSEDGAHRIHVLNMAGDPETDTILLVDDAIALREGDPTGDGDNWETFDLVTINAAGHYLVSGNTDVGEETDEYLAYDGTIAVREGDTIAGVPLATSASLRFAAINDAERAAFAWGYQMAGNFRETVFFSCNAADLANTSTAVITTFADSIDVDGDGTGDYTVEDILATADTTDVRGKAMGASPFIFLEVELDDGTGSVEAVIQIPVECCGNGLVDPGEACDDGNAENDDECLDTCAAASCGDGFVQAGVEECDDGNADDTDDCPSSCQPASCGDGFVQAGVEECDDGNTDDGDQCASDCTIVTGGTTDGGTESGVDPDGGTISGADSGTGTGDTDTAGADGGGGGGGCGCRATRRPGAGTLLGLLGFGLLGLRRRGRRPFA